MPTFSNNANDPLEIKLTAPQQKFFLSKHRYTAFVGGFGSGKSEALFVKMLYDKFVIPDVNLLYGAPTYALIRDIAHDRLCMMLDKAAGVKYNLNKAENILEIKHYGKILFRTLDTPDRIVGFEVHSAYLDELDTLRLDQAENAWNKVIARTRQKSRKVPDATNKIFVATTPEGFRFVYDRWVKRKNEHYRVIRAPTSSNPHLPDGYIEALRASYPPELVDAYLEGRFVNLTSAVVYSSYRRDLNDTDMTYQPFDVLHIGMDFNVREMAAVVHIVRKDPKDKVERAYAVAELVKGEDTTQMIAALKEAFPQHFPSRMIIYPDAYGDSRKTNASEASKTDHGLLREAGLRLVTPKANPPIKDRVQSMNLMFCDGNSLRRYFVNSKKCPNYVMALEQQTYDANQMPEKPRNSIIDDVNDAAGYFISRKFPLVKQAFSQASITNY